MIKRCDLILDVATEGFWDWNLTDDTAYLSPCYCDLLGISPGERRLDYEFYRSIIHPEDLPRVEQAIEQHLHGGKDYLVQYRMFSRDGCARWIESRGKVVEFKEDGTPSRMVGTITDISARKRAEEDLRQQASLLELTNDSIIVRDMDSRITYWNAGAAAQYGWRRDEAVGKVTHELLRTIFSVPLAAIMEVLLVTGHWEGELEHVRRDGSLITVASRWSLQRDVHGTPIAVLEINRDISTRKQAEEAVRQSEAQFRAMFELTSVGMCQADPSTGRMLRVNATLSRMMGYSEEELLRITFSEITHEDDRTLNWEDFCALVRGETSTYEVEKRFVRKDGNVIWGHVTCNIVRDDEGRPLRTVAIVNDITTRKLSDEKFASYEKRLRTLAFELATTEDRERKRLATELHENVAQCLAVARMNFRQIMNMRCPAEFEPLVNTVWEAIDEASSKVRGLLTELSPPAFVYRDLVHAIQWVADRVADQHGLAVKVEDDGLPKPVHEDIMMFLTSAVRELLTNTVKHAHSLTAEVRIERVDGRVCICVRDEGTGFDTSSAGFNYDSTGGFGLFNIRERLSHYGGTFSIASFPGGGTVVQMEMSCLPDREE